MDRVVSHPQFDQFQSQNDFFRHLSNAVIIFRLARPEPTGILVLEYSTDTLGCIANDTVCAPACFGGKYFLHRRFGRAVCLLLSLVKTRVSHF